MQTIFAKPIASNQRAWYVVDAEGKTLGRIATQIAELLRGKTKRDFSPHVDNGDYVVVLNADKIQVTGNKAKGKVYHTHSGYLGGLKTTTFAELKVKHPLKALRLAVSGMLPKNKLRKDMEDRLKLVAGDTHQFDAQKPIRIEL